MKLSFDRIEEGFAVLIGNGRSYSVPQSSLPDDATPGDTLVCRVEGDSVSVISYDRSESAARRKRINKLFNKLFDKESYK